MTVTVSKCLCGSEHCRDYWISNGKFCQGSGFDKDEADFIAAAANNRKLVEAILKDPDLVEELIAHLDYCGWGDSWERECMKESKLDTRAEAFREAVK